jgi:HlyD family secretion protein
MAKSNNNKVLWILIGVVAALLAFAVIAKNAGWIGGQDAIEVDFGKAEAASIVEKVNATGMIQPEIEVKISPDVAGEIIELNVMEGDSVYRDQLLVRIRPDNLKSVLDRTRATLNQQLANLSSQESNYLRAQANFERVRLEFDRNKKLHAEKVISDADFQQSEANFKIAQNDLDAAKQGVEAARFVVESGKASVSEAEQNVRLTNVFSPVDGIVSKLNVEQGERVVGTQQMAGTEMMTVADLNRMEVRVNVNENDIIRVSLGDTAIIDVDAYAYTGQKFKGIVTSIANSANTKASADAVTEFQVKIRILNESFASLMTERKGSAPFRPGMTASVDIITNRKDRVLSVPLSAVTTRTKAQIESGGDASGIRAPGAVADLKEVVFVHENGNVKLQEVKTGISDFDRIEIIEGLSEGQEVVSGPYFILSRRLKNGDIVSKAKAGTTPIEKQP